MDLKETGWESMDWIPLAGYCEHGNGPWGSINSCEFLDQLSKLLAFKDSAS
jgi:hypothetical protein